ncbi:hypothetical protein TNCV_4350571 [Trichonephila clavipes]|nr:hypothetical protein TNCV_4350571 [Trichonephila clavipes]
MGAETHERMSRSDGQSEARPSVFKSPSKLSTHLSTHCISFGVILRQLLMVTVANSHSREPSNVITNNKSWMYADWL